jgi:Na+/melibiose symporter-like transporter
MTDQAPTYHRAKRPKPIGFRTKFNQGIGAIPDTLKNWVFNTFTLLYYNQILGMDAFLVSFALAIAIVFDAITDPLVASFSDNLVTRWGRRHPLMLIASIPLGLSIFCLFIPPADSGETFLFCWLLGFTLATRGFMTLYFVPWAAIAAELTDDYESRTSVMAYRYALGWTIGVSFPLFIFTFVMPGSEAYPVGQLNPAGYPQMAMYAGLLLTGGAMTTTLLTRNEIPYLRQHTVAQARFSFTVTATELWRALQNKQFALLFAIVLVSSAISGTTTNLGIYMTTFFWGLETEDLRWFALSAIGAVLAFPLVGYLQRNWDKRDILISVSILSVIDGICVVGLRFLDILPDNGDPLLLVILVGMGVLTAALAVVLGIISASLIADTLDDHELRTGYRQEAMFNAALSFSGKAISGIGIMMGGLILTLINFPTNVQPTEVPPDTIIYLGITVGIFLPMLHALPIYMATRYKITRSVYAEIRDKLDQRYSDNETN